MELVLNAVGPVFAVIALGYLLAGRRALDLPTLSNLAILVTSPALMFSVLSGSELVAAQWAALAGGTTFIAAGAALLAFAYLRTAGDGRVGLLFLPRDHFQEVLTERPEVREYLEGLSDDRIKASEDAAHTENVMDADDLIIL